MSSSIRGLTVGYMPSINTRARSSSVQDEDEEEQGLKSVVVRKKSLEALRESLEVDGSDNSDSDEGSKVITEKKPQPNVLRNGIGAYLKVTLTELFLVSPWKSLLLLFTPLTIMSDKLQWGSGVTFVLGVIALVPWGDRISWVTEDFVKYTNETAGGLFLASVGNLTEIVFCINCLQGDLLRVVQVSMLGSVLSNLLLVLGCAFLTGGTKWEEQSFNKTAAITNSGLLLIAVLSICLPSILDATHTGNGTPASAVSVNLHNLTLPSVPGAPSWLSGTGSLDEETSGGDAPLWLSRFIAIVLVFLYCLLIGFQFITHPHLFEDEEGDESEGILGMYGGIFWMMVITCFIWILSEYVVNQLKTASVDLHMPMLFLSGIVIPIVGNAVEHASAVCFAMHNKMEIALGVAVGSAVQISIFVIPLTVLGGWAMDKEMTLNFHPFETVILLMATIGVSFLVSDGRSHWLKGAMLVSAYVMIAAAFYAHAEPKSMS